MKTGAQSGLIKPTHEKDPGPTQRSRWKVIRCVKKWEDGGHTVWPWNEPYKVEISEGEKDDTSVTEGITRDDNELQLLVDRHSMLKRRR